MTTLRVGENENVDGKMRRSTAPSSEDGSEMHILAEGKKGTDQDYEKAVDAKAGMMRKVVGKVASLAIGCIVGFTVANVLGFGGAPGNVWNNGNGIRSGMRRDAHEMGPFDEFAMDHDDHDEDHEAVLTPQECDVIAEDFRRMDYEGCPTDTRNSGPVFVAEPDEDAMAAGDYQTLFYFKEYYDLENTKGEILTPNTEELDDFLRSGRPGMIMYMMEMCPYCLEAAPKYERMVRNCDVDEDFVFMVVSCSTNPQACAEAKAEAVPQLRIVGGMHAAGSREWVKEPAPEMLFGSPMGMYTVPASVLDLMYSCDYINYYAEALVDGYNAGGGAMTMPGGNLLDGILKPQMFEWATTLAEIAAIGFEQGAKVLYGIDIYWDSAKQGVPEPMGSILKEALEKIIEDLKKSIAKPDKSKGDDPEFDAKLLELMKAKLKLVNACNLSNLKAALAKLKIVIKCIEDKLAMFDFENAIEEDYGSREQNALMFIVCKALKSILTNMKELEVEMGEACASATPVDDSDEAAEGCAVCYSSCGAWAKELMSILDDVESIYPAKMIAFKTLCEGDSAKGQRPSNLPAQACEGIAELPGQCPADGGAAVVAPGTISVYNPWDRRNVGITVGSQLKVITRGSGRTAAYAGRSRGYGAGYGGRRARSRRTPARKQPKRRVYRRALPARGSRDAYRGL